MKKFAAVERLGGLRNASKRPGAQGGARVFEPQVWAEPRGVEWTSDEAHHISTTDVEPA